jgi:hypothetical protein
LGLQQPLFQVGGCCCVAYTSKPCGKPACILCTVLHACGSVGWFRSTAANPCRSAVGTCHGMCHLLVTSTPMFILSSFLRP